MVDLSLARVLKRRRFRSAITVVSGLPRSGTSLMMQMLGAGGIELLTDEVRRPDEDNPKGYYEFEQTKRLTEQIDPLWLNRARGKAVKVISYHLQYLPNGHHYRVVFMERDLQEIMASQAKMLARRRQPATIPAEQMKRAYIDHLTKVRVVLALRPCLQVLRISFEQAVLHPWQVAAQVQAFLGQRLDLDAMAEMALPSLYRNRRTTLPVRAPSG